MFDAAADGIGGAGVCRLDIGMFGVALVVAMADLGEGLEGTLSGFPLSIALLAEEGKGIGTYIIHFGRHRHLSMVFFWNGLRGLP